MIFQVKCTVEELAGTCPDELEEIFSNLIDADRSGRHFFVLKRELCGWIINNIELSRINRTHLNSIREKYSSRGGLLKVAGAYVNITIGNAPITLDERDVFSIGHKLLLKGKYLLNESYLIVENSQSDGELYNYIFDRMKKITNIPSINIDVIHGGGSTIDNIFFSNIEEGKIVVCIVDHDRRAPMDKMSVTAKNVIQIYEKKNEQSNNDDKCFIGLAIETVGRELENYIPYNLFKIMYNDSYQYFEELDRLFSQVESTTSEIYFWLYFDVKNGFKGSKFNTSVCLRDWISCKLECEYKEIESIDIPGFGNSVVDVFFKNPEALGEFHKIIRSNCWKSTFGAHFERLIWYFAAPIGVRT